MNLQHLSLEQLETERGRLREEIKKLDTAVSAHEQNWQKYKDTPQYIRRDVDGVIEQLVAALLPDLSARSLEWMKTFFPNQPNLYNVAPQISAKPNASLWGAIKRAFGGGGASDSSNAQLEKQRVILRGLLWNLTSVPPQSGNLSELFRTLLQKKPQLAEAEKSINEYQAKANEAILRRKPLIGQFDEYENEIARRRGKVRRRRNNKSSRIHDSDDDIYYYSSLSEYERGFYYADTDDSSDDSGSGQAASQDYSNYADASNNYSDSSSSDAARSENFSYGGGGDYDGGGAGGSWENYS